MRSNTFSKLKFFGSAIGLFCSVNALSVGDASVNPYYAGFNAGVVIPSNIQGSSDLQSSEVDNTFAVGAVFGRRLNDRFMVELQYIYRGKSDVNNSTSTSTDNLSNSWGVSANSFIFNLKTNLLPGYDVGFPYLKIGAGVSINDADNYVYKNKTGTDTWAGKNSSEFAWQVGLGVNLAICRDFDTVIEYAYIDRGDFSTKSGQTTVTSGGASIYDASIAGKTGKLREQMITLGIQYKF